MNTNPRTENYSHILDAHANIGQIILRPDHVLTHPDPLLRSYQFGQFGDSLSPERPIAARSRFGQWLLMIGRQSIRRLMTNIIVGLAQHEDVRVLDCGDQFDPPLAASLTQENAEVFEHIRLKQAGSCAQVLDILDHTSISPAPFVGLDLLHPFEDASIDLETRKDILKGCLQNLRRLQLSTGGLVSLCPPNPRADEQAGELYTLVEQEAPGTFDVTILYPVGQTDDSSFR